MEKEKYNYFHTGHLIDGSGNAEQKNIILTIKNNLIIAIEPFNTTHGKKITHDFSNCTIFPTLADAHVHLAMSGTLDMKYRQAQLSMNFDQAQLQIKQHLDHYSTSGISIVRDGGDHFGHVFKFNSLFKQPVTILSPKIGWYRAGRYGQFAGESIDLTDNCLEIISKQHQGSHIKIIQSGINSVRQFGKETKPQFSKKEMTAICKWAYQRNIPIMVHANGALPVKISIDSGCTSIEHGYFMGDDNLKKMADKQIFWVPTLIPMYELAKNLNKNEEKDIALRTFDIQCEQVRKAKDYGVPIVLGSDAGSFGVNHVQGLFDEMKLMRVCGFSLSQIIQSCTSLSRLLFNSSNTGLLKKGELAQFVVFESEPDAIIEKIQSDKCLRTFFLNNA
jgi:imidazolonepropionase-like amidohydrolase